MSLAFNVFALTVVTAVLAALLAVPVAVRRERALTRRERRIAATTARNFAATDAAGYVQRPDWGGRQIHPRPSLDRIPNQPKGES